jgi:hypothetical protein
VDDRSPGQPIRGTVPGMTYAPVITTQSDLLDAWRHLMEPLGFAGPSVWMLLIGGDDVPLPVLHEISEAHHPPTPAQAAGLASVLASVAADHPGSRWAFLRARPGRHGPDADDRGWAQALVAACRRAGAACDVVHLATDDRLVPLPVDDLALPA